MMKYILLSLLIGFTSFGSSNERFTQDLPTKKQEVLFNEMSLSLNSINDKLIQLNISLEEAVDLLYLINEVVKDYEINEYLRWPPTDPPNIFKPELPPESLP